MENLEVIRSATSDGSSRRFSLCSCCHDPFDFIEYYSIQMLDGMSQAQYMQSRTAQK